jgi:acyl transferase domain-containing protein
MTAATPIAVVGLACRFPGAEAPDALIRLLRSGGRGLRPIPPERWAMWGLAEADPLRAAFPVMRAGCLDGIDLFDRHPFRISATEAPVIDPQQRLVLETSWHALEDAGLSPACLEDAPVGVYIGAAGSDYGTRMLQAGLAATGNLHVANGAQNGAISGRVSYCLGLTGPSLTIDTACSSGAAAVALAGDALRLGQCDMALAGGVNALLSTDPFRALAAMRVLSAKGETRSFDAAAAGFVRAEGCGILVLKRLPDAVAARDRIHAVLPGWAMGQDGRSNGLSAPSRRAQARVVARALQASGLDPAEVGAIEAHGSATGLGDVIEMAALADVFGGRSPGRIAVGSVKANIGHLEAAAGIAGLIKAILMVRDGFVPAQPGFQAPSPRIAWDDIPFDVPRETRDWPGPRRIMGVSSFGMSGLNAHVLVANADVVPDAATPRRAPHLFLLSAATAGSLTARARQLMDEIAAPSADLHRIAEATTRRWMGMAYRHGLVASSPDEARTALLRYLEAPPPRPAGPGASVTADSPGDRADLRRRQPDVCPEPPVATSRDPGTAPAASDDLLEHAVLARFLAGANLRPEAISVTRARPVDLPAYPFDRQRHWFDAPRPARSSGG